jgi:Domain of unknown function (DUF4166)
MEALMDGAEGGHRRSIYVEILVRGGLDGVAEVCEWHDDARDCFRIEVDVSNQRWGPLFGYRGSFRVEWRTVVPGQVPAHLLPARYERRE